MSKNPRPTSHDPPPAVTPEVMALVCLDKDIRFKEDLTRELLEQLVIAARIGGFRKQTALACRVRPEMLEYWITEGMRKDAPELMQELSARFQGVQGQQNLLLTAVISTAALRGDWQAAVTLLSKRDPQWAGKVDGDVDLSPPEISQAERRKILVQELRNPHGELAQAMLEAGRITDEELLASEEAPTKDVND